MSPGSLRAGAWDKEAAEGPAGRAQRPPWIAGNTERFASQRGCHAAASVIMSFYRAKGFCGCH